MKTFGILALCIIGVVGDITPLNSEEAEILRSLWDRVKHREVDILYVIFKDNPDIQARFSVFVGKDLEALKGTIPFALHATRIVSFFSKVASITGNPANFGGTKTLINELAASHVSRGISKELFNKFRASLDKFMQQQPSWNDNTAAIWNKASNNFYAILSTALDGAPMN